MYSSAICKYINKPVVCQKDYRILLQHPNTLALPCCLADVEGEPSAMHCGLNPQQPTSAPTPAVKPLPWSIHKIPALKPIV